MYGGATQLKFKSNRYPNIAEFLNQQYPDLYEIADAFNKIGVLASMKPTGFILPDDKGRKHLRSLIESGDPEKAEDIFLSFILLGDYTRAQNTEKGINTQTGFQIKVEKVVGDVVHLEGGGKLTLCKDFAPFNKRAGRNKAPCKHVVWCLDGEVKVGTKENVLDMPKKFNNVVGRGEDIGEYNDLFADVMKNKVLLVSRFKEKLGRWCHWAKSTNMVDHKSFLLVRSGSPTIDYLLVFHSGAFDVPDDLPTIERPASCYESCVWSGPSVNDERARSRITDRTFGKYELAKKEYVSFAKNEVFSDTKFHNHAETLFNLHAFIFYGNETLLRYYEKDPESAELIKTMFTFVKNNPDFATTSSSVLDASRYSLDANDLNGLYSAFVEQVAFRAPITVDLKHGAGADSELSDTSLEELRAYVDAHGKFPQL